METVRIYVDSLHGKVFKILPQKEEHNPNLEKYLMNLCIEVKGAYCVFPELAKISEYIDLVNILHYLYHHDFDVMTCRVQMFKMQTLINSIQARLGGDVCAD